MSDLLNKVLQASLAVSMMGASRTDERLTLELQQENEIAVDHARAVKTLFPGKNGPMGKLRSIAGKARRVHTRLTFEGFGESRLLVITERDVYEEAMSKVAHEFESAVDTFIETYDTSLEGERAKKGKSFLMEDYPPRDKLPQMFKIKALLVPLPEPNRFLQLALGDELKKKYEQQAAAAIQNVRKEVYSTMLDLVGKTAQCLAGGGPLVDSDNKKGPLAKLQEYLERVPGLNICDDPQIASLYKIAKSQLSATTQQLRDDDMARKELAAAASRIVSSFGVLGEGRRLIA